MTPAPSVPKAELTAAMSSSVSAACHSRRMASTPNCGSPAVVPYCSSIYFHQSAELYRWGSLLMSALVLLRYWFTCLLKEEETAVSVVAQLSMSLKVLSSTVRAVPSVIHQLAA